MLEMFQSIPRLIRGIFVAFLTIFLIRVTYPITNYILNLFEVGIMYYAAVLAYWLIIIFCVTVLVWITIFKVEGVEQYG